MRDLLDTGIAQEFIGRNAKVVQRVEGVIRGKTIELEVDPGLQDGGVVEVVIRRVKQPRTWGGTHILFLGHP